MKLTDISEIKRLLAAHGAAFKKRYGQNFLTSESALRRIADNADEGVVEIGPGIGTLTGFLAERAKKVVAWEIDDALIPIRAETVGGLPNVTVLHADAMKVDFADLVAREFAGMRVSVCANLPYYITTPILTRLLGSGAGFTNVTVMVQKEVAARLCAAPGTAEYGAISVFVAYYGSPARLLKVPAGCFVPAPKVDSAVVRIDLHDAPPVEGDSDAIFRCVRAAFGQRRKTLVNALAAGYPELGRNALARAVGSCGIDPAARGETLALADFAALARTLSAAGK